MPPFALTGTAGFPSSPPTDPPQLQGAGPARLVLLVSGLRGVAHRDRRVAELEAEGWRVASSPCPLYGSVYVEREADL